MFLKKIEIHRKSSNRKKHKRAKKLALKASFFFILTLLLFFAVDQFWIYCQFLLFNDIKSQNINPSVQPSESVELAPGGEGGSSEGYGEAGVKMMLLNKMSAGYYREYLSISKSHCDWTDMQASPLQKNGEPFYPSPVFIIGTALAESGVADGTCTWAPLDPKEYNKTVGNIDAKYMNLMEANSAVFKAIGPSHVWGKWEDYMDLYNESKYATAFQFTHWAASVSPLGDRPSTEACAPSKLNGYNISKGTVRTPSQTDLAYFPDICSIVLQKCWTNLDTALNPNNLNENAESVTYAAYNGGPNQVLYSWGVGGPPVKSPAASPKNYSFGPLTSWSTKNTLTKKDCATDAANEQGALVEKCLDYFVEHMPAESEFNWRNHTDYEGLWAIMTLKGADGFLASDHSLAQLTKRVGKDAGFVRGGVLALKILGDANASVQTLKTYVSSLSAKSVDSFYGPAYIGKAAPYSEVVVHTYSKNCSVYNSSGAGPKPALHAYNSESARGVYMQGIGAYIIYWKMLLASGVEVTFTDAIRDAKGIGNGLLPASTVDYYAGTGENVWVDFHVKGSTESVQWASAMEWRTSAQTGGKSPGIHGGEDFVAHENTQICAIANGTVIGEYHTVPSNSEGNGGAGNTVTIKVDKANPTDPTIWYMYMHLQPGKHVTIGQHVNAGDIIGLSGDTGIGSGPHLHLQIQMVYDGREYRMCYNALHKGWYSVKTGPKLYWDPNLKKKANGYVYNGNYEKIGYLQDPRMKHGSQNPYEILGVHYFNWKLTK